MELYRARQGIADWTKIKKPKNFEKMVEIAAKISKNIPVVRVDLYNINRKIFFGEFKKCMVFTVNLQIQHKMKHYHIC